MLAPLKFRVSHDYILTAVISLPLVAIRTRKPPTMDGTVKFVR